jgi:thiol-disulfide isomerase/thioredoxin
MKDGFTKKIELFANAAIIVVAVVLVFVLVKKFVFNDASTAAKIPKENIAAGAKVNLPEADWAANGQTLLLILSTDCRYCHESLPFYQRIIKQSAENGRVKIAAVFPQDAETSREYLTANDITVSRIFQANPPNLGVGGTPTLLLIDKDGVVTQTWFGKLAAPEENKVLGQL